MLFCKQTSHSPRGGGEGDDQVWVDRRWVSHGSDGAGGEVSMEKQRSNLGVITQKRGFPAAADLEPTLNPRRYTRPAGR